MYQVGVCVQSVIIVWVNEQFHGGESDITIAHKAVIDVLDDGEMFEADGGFGGEYLYIEIQKDTTTD